jgi:hypothetical protein
VALRDTCSVRPDAGQVCLERFRASRHLAAQGAHHFLRAFEQESAPVGALQADRSAALRIST